MKIQTMIEKEQDLLHKKWVILEFGINGEN